MNDQPNVADNAASIALQSMGSFFFGGEIVRAADGDTFHGDHGYAQFFVPAQPRRLPIIMWHGLGQSGKTWESTPDGREGFWQLYLRRRWPVYIIDQPRRGRAGRAVRHQSEHEPEIPNLESEAVTWETFRLGEWVPPAQRAFFPNLSFARDPEAVEQFFRQQTPSTGPEPFPDREHRIFMADAMSELLDRTGPSVLMVHSHSGQYGWESTIRRSEHIKAVIAIEVGEFAFPDDDPPQDIPTTSPQLREFMAPQLVSAAEFDKLVQTPTLLIYGDNIVDEPRDRFGAELWRMVRGRARQYTEAVNKRGGDVQLVELRDLGLEGNTHFPMSDLNNIDVADLISDFLSQRKLDGDTEPGA